MREFVLRRVAPVLDTDRGLWSVVAGVCALVYALTAHWTSPGLDSEAAAWPAWSLVHRGTLDLSGIAGLPAGNIWFLHAHGQILSNRTIGDVLTGVPVNLLLGWTGISAAAAAALTAVLVSAAAMATLALVLRRLAGRWALPAIVAVAFGTAVWTVSSEELWTHTGDVLWLSLILLALSRGRHLWAGLVFVPAILTRPHLAVAAVVIALWLAASRRSLRPLLTIGVPAAVGLVLLAGINGSIFGHWSLSGGYGAVGGYSVAATAGGGLSATLRSVGTNVLGGLISPRCGVFLYSPVILVGLLGLRRGFRSAPDWTWAAALGGGMYEIAQCKINRFTGGTLFFSNRLMIECLVLCTPLLLHCARAWARTSIRRQSFALALLLTSVGIHAIGAVLPTLSGGGLDVHPWQQWFLLDTIRVAGYQGWLTCAVVALIALTAWTAFLQTARRDSDVALSSGARPESSPNLDDWQAARAHSA